MWSNTRLKKYMYVCHAEMNAIMNKISANVEGKLFFTFKHTVWYDITW